MNRRRLGDPRSPERAGPRCPANIGKPFGYNDKPSVDGVARVETECFGRFFVLPVRDHISDILGGDERGMIRMSLRRYVPMPLVEVAIFVLLILAGLTG